MKWKRYLEVQESGIPWIGSIPRSWDVKRCKTIFEIQKTIAGKLGFDILSITQNGFRVKDIESGDGQLSLDYSKYQLVYPGDFAMNPMDLVTGGADIATKIGVTSPDYRVFRLRESDSASPEFLLRVFQACYRQKIFWPYGQGSSQLGRWRFPRQQFNDFPIPFPPLPEQRAIAAFLDAETSKIDALVAEQRRLIELLKEKRQAVISHAVTKGLNPHVKMKPSGIDWLGDVPEHWEISKLKWFCTLQRGYDLTKDECQAGDIPVVTSAGITGTHSSAMAKGPGVVTGRYGTTGEVFYVEGSFWPHNTTLFVLEFYKNLPRYVWYYLQVINLSSHSAKSAVPGIDRNDIHVITIAYPARDEQKLITAKLDSTLREYDALILEAECAIALLQERRTALISAAVTGKIDVRGFVPKEATS